MKKMPVYSQPSLASIQAAVIMHANYESMIRFMVSNMV